MDKEKIEQIIKQEFRVGSLCSPFGSCTEDFLNNKVIEIAKKNNFPEDIVELFQKYPYIFPKYKKYDNGEGVGRYYINLLGIYLNWNTIDCIERG